MAQAALQRVALAHRAQLAHQVKRCGIAGGQRRGIGHRQRKPRALQQRAQEAQQLEGTRENELRYTLAMQRQAITEAVSPILTALYQEKGCGLLLDRESVFMMNPAIDLTDAAIQRLNTALPTLSFNRMPVPAQQPQQPAAAN